MNTVALKITGVQKAFGEKPVLRDATLSVHESESVVIIGRSGSGKSVTLRLILGLMQPDAGDVFVNDYHVNALPEMDLYPMRRNIGMLFQNSALWDSMNVYDNIALALRQHRSCSEEKIRDRVYDCLIQVGLAEMGDSGRKGLEDIATRFPSELSGGMKKRVGLARAIAPQPKIMLYDEPTTGLDPIMAGIINRLINTLNDDMGVTSLTITHDMQSAFEIADRLVLLHNGVYQSIGTPEEALLSEDPVVRQFLHNVEGPVRPTHTDRMDKFHWHT